MKKTFANDKDYAFFLLLAAIFKKIVKIWCKIGDCHLYSSINHPNWKFGKQCTI